MARHQHPVSQVLHAVAIPVLPVAGILLGIQSADGAWNLSWRPMGLVLLSYLLQWIGHRIEGNDMGELILLKKLMGKPYVAVSPRYQTTVAPRSGGSTRSVEVSPTQSV